MLVPLVRRHVRHDVLVTARLQGPDLLLQLSDVLIHRDPLHRHHIPALQLWINPSTNNTGGRRTSSGSGGGRTPSRPGASGAISL